MRCPTCGGHGHGTLRPDGLCTTCLGMGLYCEEDYVHRHHEHEARQAAISAALRLTYGKNGLDELETVK
jgi:hypothetical protein